MEIFPRSKTVYLKLGYFSSKAIQVLSCAIAQFIYNGGTLQIITNHFLYDEDKELLDLARDSNDDHKRYLDSLLWLRDNISPESQHFFNCLKLLVKEGRLDIVPVMLKPGRMAHYKQGVFTDHLDNMVYVDGSCNFTANGLLENAETLTVNRSWMSDRDYAKVDKKKSEIERIVLKNDEKYDYLNKDQILSAVHEIGEDKSVDELLIEEYEVIKNSGSASYIKKILERYEEKFERIFSDFKNQPRFPYLSGPREYQIEAYQRWLCNDRKGIFAMATGTGKTITSLNCLLGEYEEYGNYQAVILVPGRTLVKQWGEEVAQFNFNNIYLTYSDNRSWRDELARLNATLLFNKSQSFVVISTYTTFISGDFQKRMSNFSDDIMFIADEAHKMGSEQMIAFMPKIKFKKRLALSATPERKWDPDGEINRSIEEFFNCADNYTYSFSMRRAIDEGVLCKYDYYPHLVYLTDEEMDSYLDISQKLSRLFDNNKKVFRNPAYAKILLLERRRVIHKAVNKKEAFGSILVEQVKERRALAFTFVYVPEGEDEDGKNILAQYMEILVDVSPETMAIPYVQDTVSRDEIMADFERGKIGAIFSMKCLDEGVDVPRAEMAIFCSSTGNPRQFIQRRGRILRNHEDKRYAIIHDLVVLPQLKKKKESFGFEQKMVKDELIRVVYFASLARNHYDAMNKLKPIAYSYGLDMFAIESELEEEGDD